MPGGLLGEVIRGLESVVATLTGMSRLSGLAMLGEQQMGAQRDRARDMVLWIERAAALSGLLARYRPGGTGNVAWPSGARPDRLGLVREGMADLGLVQDAIDALGRAAATHLDELARLAARSPLYEPLLLHLRSVSGALPAAGTSGAVLQVRPAGRLPRAPVQALRGPREVPLDPIFDPAFSLLRDAALALSLAAPDSSPHLWCLAIRETMAAELCALSAVEYDGLPLAFYRDLAAQAWDETRHALFFLHCAVQLLPDFLAAAPADHPMRAGVRKFLETGRGLAVPLERNLYDLAWNADLSERLILMHHDSEAPGAAGFKRQLESAFWKARPDLRAGLEVIARDEAEHARLGESWLAHLHPDRSERRQAIGHTLRLRGIFLLAALAPYGPTPLRQLIATLGDRGPEAHR
jgi:hypothetical protein